MNNLLVPRKPVSSFLTRTRGQISTKNTRKTFTAAGVWPKARQTDRGRVKQSQPGYQAVRGFATNRCFATVAPRAPKESHHPLEGVTVVSLEQAVAAPFASRQLADLGARVIKVERPEVGDFARKYDERVNGEASHFIWTNRSKESLTLDLKQSEDLAVLKKLLEKTDVFIQNLAPGAAARLGLSHEALKDKYPQLIVCNISGFGQDGPDRDRKAYDLIIQSEGGMLAVTGTEKEPVKVGISIADIAAAMYACTNILARLIQRKETGHGSNIDISMLESMVEWMGFPMYYSFDGAPGPAPTGAFHPTVVPYGPFPTGDGGAVMFAVQNEREWANFCNIVLEDPEMIDNPSFLNNTLRTKHRDELKKIVVDKFQNETVKTAQAKLKEAKVATAEVKDMAGVWNHAQLKARHRWTAVDTPGGRVPALLPPGFPETGHNPDLECPMDPVPKIGEHTESIRKELGF